MSSDVPVGLKSQFYSPKGPIQLSISDQNVLNASLLHKPRKEGENVSVEYLLNVPISEVLAVFYHRGPIKTSLDPLESNWNLNELEANIQFINEFVEEKSAGNNTGGNNCCGRKKSGLQPDSASLIVYSMTRKFGDANLWRLKISHFTCESDLQSCRDWKMEIQRRLNALSRPRNLLTFVNPFGGKRKAPKIYEKFLRPILKLCGVRETLIMTEHANHAKEFLQTAELANVHGVICVGGDGMFNEVLSGLVERTQRESEVDLNDRHSRLKRVAMRIGIIAAGSTNALCHTAQGNCDFLTSALHIVIGDQVGIDVCSIHNSAGLLRLASTATSYGFLGEVLRESEELRAFGPTRYTLAGLKVICQHPTFRGSVKFLPAPAEVIHAGEKLQRCRVGCTLCSATFEQSEVDENATESIPPWVEIRDDFVHLVGVVTACVTYRSPQGLWPPVHLGDGTVDIAMVGNVSRCANMAFVGRIMTPGSDHTTFGSVRVFRVGQFSFTPISALEADFSDSVANGDSNGADPADSNLNLPPKLLGSWNVDGEIMPQRDETFHFRVHRQLITLFARGIEA